MDALLFPGRLKLGEKVYSLTDGKKKINQFQPTYARQSLLQSAVVVYLSTPGGISWNSVTAFPTCMNSASYFRRCPVTQTLNPEESSIAENNKNIL